MGGAFSNTNTLPGINIKDIPSAEEIRKMEEKIPGKTYMNSYIPKDTIKMGYDVYKGNNWTDQVRGYDRLGGGDQDALDCGKVEVSARDVFTLDGELHKGDYRHITCGEICDLNCDAWPDQGDGKKGPVYGVKIPVGSKLTIQEGDAGNSTKPEDHNCYLQSGSVNRISWGGGDFSNENHYPRRLPDDVATGCAGGYDKLRGEFVNTANGYKIKNDVGNNEETNKCFLGVRKIAKPNRSFCLKGEIDNETYCQMGDYISNTQHCRKLCDYTDKTIPTYRKWCRLGYERLCKKRKGDPIKRGIDGNIVYSNIDYIKDDPQCYKFCGSAGEDMCQDIKNDICTRNPQEWKEPGNWIPGYCREHWQKNPDRTEMDKACKAELLKEGGDQNIFSGVGCGTLCMGEGTDVDSDWCKSLKAEYCRKDDKNMLTDDCYDFCSSNPDLCDDYLSGNSGMCSRMGIKTQDDLDKEVPGTLHKYSDWCGCMMPRGFYEDYANEIDAKFNKLGYSILGQIDLSPECMYPKCKQGSIMTAAQYKRKADGLCTDCVQIMLQTLDGSYIDSNIASEQSASCGRIKKSFLLPGVYNVKSVDKYIKVFDNRQYCSFDSKDDIDDTDKQNISIVESIPGDNLNAGACYGNPGYYYVTQLGQFIRIHDDHSYCVFPQTVDFGSKGVDYEIIETIPVMNNKLEEPCEYNPITPPTGIQGGFVIGDLSEENSSYVVVGICIFAFILVVIIALLIWYYRRKKH